MLNNHNDINTNNNNYYYKNKDINDTNVIAHKNEIDDKGDRCRREDANDNDDDAVNKLLRWIFANNNNDKKLKEHIEKHQKGINDNNINKIDTVSDNNLENRGDKFDDSCRGYELFVVASQSKSIRPQLWRYV